jgi:hypothetical protein
MVRNRIVAGYPVGVASGFGMHYFMGEFNYQLLLHGEGYFRDNDAAAKDSVRRLAESAGFDGIDLGTWRSDPSISRHLDALARADVLERPTYNLGKMIIRLPLTWIHQQNERRTIANAALLLPLFLAGGVGLAFRFKPYRSGLLGGLLLINCAFAVVFAEAIPMRYALPLLPLLLFWTALGLDHLRDQQRDRLPPLR